MAVKLVQYYFFHLLKHLCSVIEWLRLKATGEFGRQTKYETSAKVSKILTRFKYYEGVHDNYYSKEDFLCVHERLDHPNIILSDNISLYTVTPEEAVFVDCGEFDVFGEEVAFMYISQYEKALKIITLPIESFHLIASQIPIPKAPLLHIANHGRCGSTLMYRVFQGIPNTLSMSEPYSLVALAEYSRNGRLTKKQLRTMCISIIKCIIKHASHRQSELVCLGAWSVSIYVADVLFDVWPTMKHIYLFRQPVPCTRSWEKLQIVNNWSEMTVDLLKKRCGIGHNQILAEYPLYSDDYLANLNRFSKWALQWITCNAAFNSCVKKGYLIASVKFEDFLKDPDTMVLQLFKYFEIPSEKLPDMNRVLSMDSQVGSPFTSRKSDQGEINNQLIPITDAVKGEVNMMCKDYKVPLFWDTDVYLENNINEMLI